MAQPDTICNVTNRSHSNVVYNIPEENIRREFSPGETKKIKFSELEQLSYRPGGSVIIEEYFFIDHKGAVEDLGIVPEPEYYLDEEGVKDVLLNGSIDEFLDMIENAPEGVIELVKALAVSLPVTDTRKLDGIFEYTGFNASAAIQHNKEEKTAEEKTTTAATSTRRTEPKYKIVSK